MRYLFAFILTLSFLIVNPVYAEEFSVTHIGGLATGGKHFNQWWYEPQRVVLKGTGTKESNIPIMFDNKTDTIKVNSTGKWEFDMGSLEIADHSVAIGSEGKKYSFILTIGSSPPADMNKTKGGELPSAGSVIPLIGIIGFAGALIFYSFKRKEA